MKYELVSSLKSERWTISIYLRKESESKPEIYRKKEYDQNAKLKQNAEFLVKQIKDKRLQEAFDAGEYAKVIEMAYAIDFDRRVEQHILKESITICTGSNSLIYTIKNMNITLHYDNH